MHVDGLHICRFSTAHSLPGAVVLSDLLLVFSHFRIVCQGPCKSFSDGEERFRWFTVPKFTDFSQEMVTIDSLEFSVRLEERGVNRRMLPNYVAFAQPTFAGWAFGPAKCGYLI